MGGRLDKLDQNKKDSLLKSKLSFFKIYIEYEISIVTFPKLTLLLFCT